MRILFLFVFLFVYCDVFAIAVESKSIILTMHDSSESFIPKEPDVPKVDSKVFESSDLTDLKKSTRIKTANSNKNLSKSDGDLALPDAWFFSIGFKSKSDPNFIFYYKKLKQLKISVFKLYCKYEKYPVQLHIGPFFGKDHKEVMRSIIKKTDDLTLREWLVKNMVAENFEPTSCEFIS